MVTIDETLAADQTYAERVIWRKWAREVDLPVRTEEQLVRVEKDGNALTATFRSELSNKECQLSAAQIVFDYGTIPADELYRGLRSSSSNDGVTNLENWVAGRGVGDAQSQSPAGRFELHRIGDAVSSRNIHAAVTDALRLCQNC